jgi:ribonuclease R
MVTVTSLADYDEFRMVEGDYSLVGMRSGRKFRMGDKVTIKVVAANLAKRQLDYEWVLTTIVEDADGIPTDGKEKLKKKKKKGE